ncbi:hypothetical protein LY625_02085 [Lysobacter sp. GX 14042]|uniref:hypothetical protein n=1 Tax=Lysobacter sp. GX 14042 TaxID=2907155 RepID=UPI001F34CA27|nr:hypothetical protein [Lysobacter sp. GX 14042]MCE7031423.1 hypothetical protein [Lysobacter sp. GX 14042]
MIARTNDPLVRNSVFLWIALGTGLLLLSPLVAMQFTPEVVWTRSDFLVMGVLLFGIASLFVFLARKVQRRHRLLVGLACAAVFLWIWAELAVGVFTDWGS